MPIEAKIVGGNELALKFNALADAAKESFTQTLVGLQYTLQARIKQLISGDLLKNHTNQLRNSIALGDVRDTGDSISAAVGSNLVYARIQDQGGTIHPKTAKFLTIPLEAVLTASGVARYSARDIIENPKVGGFDGTFFRNGMLFGTAGHEITPLFVLKASVTIPAHHYMAAALAGIQPEAERKLRNVLQEMVHR